MNVHRSRKLLWAGAAVMAACGIACVIVGVLLPYEAQSAHPGVAQMKSSGVARAEKDHATLEAFAQVWDKPLRAPLVDPPSATQPAVAAVATTAPANVSAFRLAGTIVERGHNYALLITPDGQVDLKGVGEKSSGADVDAVSERSVTLRIE